MRIGKISLAAVAVATLAGAPVLAQVAATNTTVSRASAESADENNLDGSGIVIALLAVAAVVGGIIIASDNDEDAPTSP